MSPRTPSLLLYVLVCACAFPACKWFDTAPNAASATASAESPSPQEMAQSCEKALRALDSSSTRDADYVLLGDPVRSRATKEVLLHLASAKLTVDDLKVDRDHLSCADDVWSRLVKALAVTPTAWTTAGATTAVPNPDDPYPLSDGMQTALASNGLSESVKQQLRSRAEAAAGRAISKSSTKDMQGAKDVCDQTRALAETVGPTCSQLVTRYKAISQSEDTAQSADDGRRLKECLASCAVGGDTASDQDLVETCVKQCGADDAECVGACRLHKGGTKSDRCAIDCSKRFPGGL